MSTDILERGTRQGAHPATHEGMQMIQRVAFITGGMGGIGTAVCRRLSEAGHKVVAGCLPGYEHRDEWLKTMRGDGFKVFAAEGNVEDYDSCAEMFYRVRSTVGPVDILVNAAGITRDGVFKRMSQDDWYSVINTNLNSVFNVTRQVIEGMISRSLGRIINISSVNAIKAHVLKAIIDQIPMGRLARPAEIAGLIGYLASEEAGYITGANISINGGLHMN